MKEDVRLAAKLVLFTLFVMLGMRREEELTFSSPPANGNLLPQDSCHFLEQFSQRRTYFLYRNINKQNPNNLS